MKPISAPRHPERSVLKVPLQSIRPNPSQPRKLFPESSIAELAESIRLHGLLSPLLVRRISAEHYELIAGERRLRALTMLNRSCAEVIVLSAYDCDCALLALIENLQRENLHYLDEAEACRSILDKHEITQEALARSLTMNPSTLANRLRLLKLPDSVRNLLRTIPLSERHARALLALSTETDQLRFTEEALAQHLSVKQLENRIHRHLRTPMSHRQVSGVVRDNRIVINAVLDTVRELKKIGVSADSRIEEREGGIDVIVMIRTASQKEI